MNREKSRSSLFDFYNCGTFRLCFAGTAIHDPSAAGMVLPATTWSKLLLILMITIVSKHREHTIERGRAIVALLEMELLPGNLV